MKKWKRYTLGLLILSTIIMLTYRHIDFSQLHSISIIDVFFISSTILVSLVFRGYVLQSALKHTRIKLKFCEWFGLHAYVQLLNLFLPLRGGLSIKAIYLKTRHKLPVSEYLGIQSGLTIFQVIITIFVGVILVSHTLNAWWIFILAVIVTTIAMLLLKNTTPYESRKDGKLSQLTSMFINAMLELVKNGKMIELLILNLIIIIFMAITFLLAAQAMSINTTFTTSMIIIVAVTIINIASLTPGNLGIQEFAGAFMAQQFGLDFNSSLLAMLLIRACSIIALLLSSPVIFPLQRNFDEMRIS